jgi:hypothetical protein
MKRKYIILIGFIILLSSCASRIIFVHDYNYKTIIDERPNKNEYNHFNNKSFDGLCDIKYGFLKNPELIKAYNSDGKLVARCGPPFNFSINLEKIKRDIDYIKFDSIEIVTKSGTYDLLNLKDISYQTYIYYYGKFKEKNYDTSSFVWEMDDLNVLQQLKKEHIINIIELRSRGIEKNKKRLKEAKNEYNEEEIKMILEEKGLDFKFIIEHIPINVDYDEEVTVKVVLLFTMSNGDIKRIQFENIYFREYSKINFSGLYFIELLPKEENVKF